VFSKAQSANVTIENAHDQDGTPTYLATSSTDTSLDVTSSKTTTGSEAVLFYKTVAMTCPVKSFNSGQYLTNFIFFTRQKKNLFLIELPFTIFIFILQWNDSRMNSMSASYPTNARFESRPATRYPD
jgi:hypothetical protein